MKKIFKILCISIVLIASLFCTLLFINDKYFGYYIPKQRMVISFLSHNLINYKANFLPQKGENFIVRNETGMDIYKNRTFVNLLEKAFPEYVVVFDDDVNVSPHLIIRGFEPTNFFNGTLSVLDELNAFAPYFVVNIEPWNFHHSRYRLTGYPFIEFTSYNDGTDMSIFLPFISIAKKKSFIEIYNKQTNNGQKKRYRSKGIAYVSTNCKVHRETLYRLLVERLGSDKVHALGRCSHDSTLFPEDTKSIYGLQGVKGYYDDLIDIYSQYNFVFALENGYRPGYLTEKIANAFEGGAVPIFWGDSDMSSQLFNTKSYIDVSSFASLDAAADYIATVLQSQDQTEKYLNEKMFVNINDIDPILRIGETKLNNEAEALIDKMAQQLRERYLIDLASRGGIKSTLLHTNNEYNLMNYEFNIEQKSDSSTQK